MRKASLLITLVIFFAGRSCCQQKVFSYNYSGTKYDASATSFIPNPEKDFFIFSIVTDRWAKRYFSDNEKNIPLLEQHSSLASDDSLFKYHGTINEKLLIFYRRMVFAAGVYEDKKIIELLRSRVRDEMCFFETDLVSGKSIVTDTLKWPRSETIIHCTLTNGELTIITFVDRTNVLNIYKRQKGQLKKTSLNIVLPGDNIKLNKTIPFSKNQFGIYDNNQRYHVLFASPQNKAFIHKDRLVLTLTDKNADVYAVIVNTGDASYIVKKFAPPAELPDKKMNVNSAASFLIDSLLVTCHATDNKLGVRIFNLDSEQLQLSQILDENNIAQFETEPIQRTGSFTSKSDINESKFSKFCTTVKNNDLSVSGYTDKGKLFLSFGAEYKQVINGTTLLNLLLSTAGTYFINASGDYYGYFISGYQGVNNDTYTSFDATLTLPDFTPTRVFPNYSVWEKLTVFATLKRLTPSNSKYFYMNNYYYVGYFDNASRNYFVHRFDERGVK
jgi:hypothetical protein